MTVTQPVRGHLIDNNDDMNEETKEKHNFILELFHEESKVGKVTDFPCYLCFAHLPSTNKISGEELLEKLKNKKFSDQSNR